MIKRKNCFLAAILLIASSSMVACDHNDQQLSDQALEEFTVMMSNAFGVFSLLSIELVPESTSQKTAASKDIYPCPNGGEVDFNVTNLGGLDDSITYDLDFHECNGINGSLEYKISGEFSEEMIDLDISLDGSITEACQISFTQFNERVVADLTGGPSSIAFTVNGRISSTCGDEAFSCRFENDSFDTSDTSFFQDRCSLN